MLRNLLLLCPLLCFGCSSVGEQLASGGFGLVPDELSEYEHTMVAEAAASKTEARAALSTSTGSEGEEKQPAPNEPVVGR